MTVNEMNKIRSRFLTAKSELSYAGVLMIDCGGMDASVEQVKKVIGDLEFCIKQMELSITSAGGRIDK